MITPVAGGEEPLKDEVLAQIAKKGGAYQNEQRSMAKELIALRAQLRAPVAILDFNPFP